MATIDRIVVGVDEYPSSLPAADLAVREAALHGLPIHLVHADPWANHPAWRDQQPDPDMARSAPQQAIHAALGRVKANRTPGVSSEIVAGNPVPVLLKEAATARMLIVGHRGGGGFTELALGSVARQLAAHAPCPVLVARGDALASGPVLVGVDGSPANDPAVGFAFAEASLRGVDLIAFHTWIDPVMAGPGDMMPLVYDPSLVEAEEQGVLTDALAPWRNKFPEVTVHERLERGRATRVLLEATHRAQLVVVGARGRGGFPGLRLGSVSHALLHHSHCPVAVVRHDAQGDHPTIPRG